MVDHCSRRQIVAFNSPLLGIHTQTNQIKIPPPFPRMLIASHFFRGAWKKGSLAEIQYGLYHPHTCSGKLREGCLGALFPLSAWGFMAKDQPMDGRAGTHPAFQETQAFPEGVWIYLLHKSTRVLPMKSGILEPERNTRGAFQKPESLRSGVGSGILTIYLEVIAVPTDLRTAR